MQHLQRYKADLHIHTALSPCADLSMSPATIIEQARRQGLSLIGIVDHNSTRNATVVQEMAAEVGLLTLTGAEVTTAEEVHCLAFFEQSGQLQAFQQYLEEHIVQIPDPDGQLGDQPVVDREENVVEIIPYWLPAALRQGISAVQRKVVSLNGLFIPAHINRPANGIMAQLGFLPPDLSCTALEFFGKARTTAIRQAYCLPPHISLISSSDAHFPEQIGVHYSVFYMQELSFSEVRKALARQGGRRVQTL
ncbi:MAG: PHP domain-containing protein [Desulfobulbaceae bacterium]|nr:PHP domain-containing protein [Desulfobulbaceae bacterium]